jgi:glyoxylate reductase
MSKYQVVMISPLMAPAFARVAETCDIKLWDDPAPIPRDLLYEWLQTAEGLVPFATIRVDDELLDHAPRLRVIAQAAVGYDNININACSRRGIPYGNTPGVLVETTAELAFGLLLTAARRIHEGWDFVRGGKWPTGQHFPFGVQLHGKTLGIVGMGQIGAAVARRAAAFGMRVVYHNRHRRPDEQAFGAEYQPFDSLLGEADFVVVLAPLSAETRGLFGREQFAKMKPTAYFINAARGPIVDTEALTEALASGKIAYAALDVTDPEPLAGDHPLLKQPNLLITPHIGSATTETRVAMAQLTADNLLAGLAGKRLPACVNPGVNYK